MSRSTFDGSVLLKPEDFRLLRDLLAQRTGLSFSADARASVETAAAGAPLGRVGVTSFAEYYQYLRFNPRAATEWDEAIDLLTTNETYFYPRGLPAPVVLGRSAARCSTRRPRAAGGSHCWSAGCSTGEEAYTIAMLVRQSGLFEGWDIKIFGSDISKRCIAGNAGARRTARRALRSTPPDAKRAYFIERPDGYYVVDRVRALYIFGSMNLFDEERTRLLGRIDAIFCRQRPSSISIAHRAPPHDRHVPRAALPRRRASSWSLWSRFLNVTTAFELLHLREDPSVPKAAAECAKVRRAFEQAPRGLIVDDSAYNRRILADIFYGHARSRGGREGGPMVKKRSASRRCSSPT